MNNNNAQPAEAVAIKKRTQGSRGDTLRFGRKIRPQALRSWRAKAGQEAPRKGSPVLVSGWG